MSEVFVVMKKQELAPNLVVFIDEVISVFSSKQVVENFLDKLNTEYGNPTYRTKGYIFDFEMFDLDQENKVYEF